MKRTAIHVSNSIKNLPSIHPRVVKKNSLKKKLNKSKNISALSLSPKLRDIKEQITETDSSKIETNYKLINNCESKLKKLLQVIKEQDEYICSVESQLALENKCFSKKTFQKNLTNASSTEYPDLSQSKNEEIIEFEQILKEKKTTFNLFIMQQSTRNTQKDKEILRLKSELEKTNSIISKLTTKSEKHSKKLQNCEENRETLKTFERYLTDIQTKHESDIKLLKTQIENKKTEINLKISDIEELGNILKRSEDQRFHVGKFRAEIEISNERIIERMKVLAKEKFELQLEVQEVENKIRGQERVVSRLMARLKEVEERVEKLREKNLDLNFKFEAGKEELCRVQASAEKMKKEFQDDLDNLLEALDRFQKGQDSDDKILIRRATLGGNKLATFDLVENEFEYLQQAYNLIQTQIVQSKNTLIKLKKNEAYLQSQLKLKETMIQQLEKLSEKSNLAEKKLSKIEENKKVKNNSLRELLHIIEEIKENLKIKEIELKCVCCAQIPYEPYIIEPCGHLYCLNCMERLKNFCMNCGSAVGSTVCSQGVNKLFKYFRKITESCVMMKKILGVDIVN